ncbi:MULTISPECIES: hypothetical protein [unclassified Halomonas]|uniref:hypothetical protein n=1 Tax=unclassified Halomonas TaxID=2609666 RepID=UPI000AA138FD|nr:MULTISPECIES: hypothetical protein [unclassified Halomonas]MBY5940999.1 hypothetical protein [Halomonas sp. DP5N14-9]MCO7216022.1 hypothetical protein [Halomonas sp. OfavH-34-E]
MDTSTEFNKVWIIESLRPGDIETGKSLYNDVLLPIAQSNPDLHVDIECPVDRDTFFKALDKVKKDCERGLFPMLHFECHGGEEGFQLGNGEIIEWHEVRDALISISIASNLNVVIVVAACNGIHLINVCTQLDRAPFWAIIGPEEKVMDLEVKRDFAAFYRKFFESLNGDDAMLALNRGVQGRDRPYHFLTSIGLFKRAYIAYHRTSCQGKGKQARIENLVTQAMKDPKCKALGVNEVRRRIKDRLAQEEHHFQNLKKRFFLMDLYPKNATRFPITYDDIISSLPS